MSYVAERCVHRRGRWLPRTDAGSDLARNYTIMLRNRAHDAAAGNAYIDDAARLTPRADQRANLRQRFDRYADEWRAQTAHTSVLARRIMHPSYQKIIGLGREALPLILDRLSSQPDHWFWALRSISDEDPVRPEDVGRFDAMRDAWIEWGRDRGLVR
jgi:hypothetical protein